MVETKPFPDGYRATGKAGELEYVEMVQALSKYGRLPKFLQKNRGTRGRSRGGGEVGEDEFQKRRSAWMIGRAESHEREERCVRKITKPPNNHNTKSLEAAEFYSA